MIQRINISGVHTEVNADLQKYITKKIGKLDSYISKHARKSAHAEVVLKESKVRARKNCTCEVILHLPQEIIKTEETTINMFAAVDIVEARLKNQLKKYKDKHDNPHVARRLWSRLRHQQAEI